MERQTLLEDLDKLDFFRYVEAGHLDHIRNGLVDNIINAKAFFSPLGNDYKSLDGRLFSFDVEELVEGGAVSLFMEMQPSIEKAGLKVSSVSQVFEDGRKGARSKYVFFLNGRGVSLWSVPKVPILLQGFLTKRFLDFLNTALRRGGVEERLYVINDKACSTQLAFLSKRQVEFIKSLSLDPGDRPYRFSVLSVFRPVFEIVGIIFKAIFMKKNKGS